MKRKVNFITVICCIVTVAIFSGLFFVLPDSSISQKENRTLSQVPYFSASNLFSGEYTADLSEYISDQFPARDAFVAVKAYSELLLGKGENNGVIHAQSSTLVARGEITENRLQENLETVKEFENAVGVPVCLGILPRSVDVFSEYLPVTYPKQNDVALWQDFYDTANTLGLTAPKFYDTLCKSNNYYRTDHHYTSYGAYQTYELLGDALGYEPYSTHFFKHATVSTNFCGTSMRSSGFYLVKKDKITLFRYDGDTDYIVTADGKESELYDFSRLDSTDKYAVFLGGNHARVDINSKEDKPNMLIIRDSFADSLAPFLALHYDLTLIDLRYYNDDIQQLVCDEDFDCVLILESITEFSSAKNISYLRMGLAG